MIISEMGRGLGNTMFVYAAALSLAKHHKTELELDTTFLKSWPRWEKYGGLWEFELGRFNITAKEASKQEIRRFIYRTGFRPIDKIIRRYNLFERRVYRFPSNGSLKDFFNLPDNIYLWGYMGREKFFKSIKNQIKNEFTLKDEFKAPIKSILKEVTNCNSVSIHVRRGDLVRLKQFRPLDLLYYQKAIDLIKSKVKNPLFYVFSDELSWCKENLNLGVKLNFIEGYKSYQDLEIMRSCKNNILANSALSWWAGYLNNNRNKIVIAPKEFTNLAIKINPQDLADLSPKDWIKI
ncbi:MAG: alpha-1,2-fucosyltransferase [Nanoarchaeota archaeon]